MVGTFRRSPIILRGDRRRWRRSGRVREQARSAPESGLRHFPSLRRPPSEDHRTGDRHCDCQALASKILRRLVDRYGPDLVIVHGDATGVDEWFGMIATGMGLSVEPHPADRDKLGKRAGPIRNAEMVAAGASFCIAVHRFIPRSKGTKDCALQAIAAGIPTYLIDSYEGKPKRLLADDPRLE